MIKAENYTKEHQFEVMKSFVEGKPIYYRWFQLANNTWSEWSIVQKDHTFNFEDNEYSILKPKIFQEELNEMNVDSAFKKVMNCLNEKYNQDVKYDFRKIWDWGVGYGRGNPISKRNK